VRSHLLALYKKEMLKQRFTADHEHSQKEDQNQFGAKGALLKVIAS
jgi:hypothetical protein